MLEYNMWPDLEDDQNFYNEEGHEFADSLIQYLRDRNMNLYLYHYGVPNVWNSDVLLQHDDNRTILVSSNGTNDVYILEEPKNV